MEIIKDNHRIIFAVTGISLGAAAVGIIAFDYFLKRYRYWNSEFKEVGKVKELFIYPIKSGKAMSVPWFDCKKNGAEFNENKDRHFLIVDEKTNHLFLRAKQYPKLTLVESKIENGILFVTVPNNGKSTVQINLNKIISKNDIRNAILHFNQKQEGFDCGDEIGKLLTDFLEVGDRRNVRLLYFVDGLKTERDFTTNQKFWINPVPILRDHLAYQDLANFMLTTQSSVDELNHRLCTFSDDDDENKCQISTRNFRSNISIERTKPFDEDYWLDVKIGENGEFSCFRPCTRCIVTTIDPDKGSFVKNMQPLRMLKTYRLVPEKLRKMYGESPVFGVYMIAKNEGGKINIGDKVFVRYKHTPF